MILTLSTTGPKVQCQIEQRAYIRLFAKRDQPGLRQAGIEIGRWDNMVRRPFREVSNLNTENLTPCETFPARLNLPMFPFVKKGRKRKRAGTRRGR